jgi:hypothetical protein
MSGPPFWRGGGGGAWPPPRGGPRPPPPPAAPLPLFVALAGERAGLRLLRVADALDLGVELRSQTAELGGLDIGAAHRQGPFLGLERRLDLAVLRDQRARGGLKPLLERAAHSRVGDEPALIDHRNTRRHLRRLRLRLRGAGKGQHAGEGRGRKPVHQKRVEIVRSKNCSLS